MAFICTMVAVASAEQIGLSPKIDTPCPCLSMVIRPTICRRLFNTGANRIVAEPECSLTSQQHSVGCTSGDPYQCIFLQHQMNW